MIVPDRQVAWNVDHHLVTDACAGNDAAVAALVGTSAPDVHRLARLLCAHRDDAEDAAQESLIILFRRIGTLRTASAFTSWTFQVVLRECLRRLRARTRTQTPAGQREASSAEDLVLRRDRAARIAESIAALPWDQREVLIRRDLHGESGRTVANALGLTVGAMKSRLRRARVALQHELDEYGPPRSPQGSQKSR